jgi:hypothetical protein
MGVDLRGLSSMQGLPGTDAVDSGLVCFFIDEASWGPISVLASGLEVAPMCSALPRTLFSNFSLPLLLEAVRLLRVARRR